MRYFDWNATAPLHPEVREVWLRANEELWANPSTPYRAGRKAHLALDGARTDLASLFGVKPERVVFTSGATESNNGCLRHAARLCEGRAEVWVSAVEHPSLLMTAEATFGTRLVRSIPVDRNGVVDLDWMRDQMGRSRPALVGVMVANNETGVLQPLREIGDLCRDRGVPLHCDAVQAFGKVGLAEMPPEASLAISGHKLGGPKGVGAMILGASQEGLVLQEGGAQESGMRAGTEDLPSILAMVHACKLRCGKPLSGEQMGFRDTFEAGLLEAFGEAVVIHGKGAARLWNTCSLALPGPVARRWILQLDRRGIAVSSGSACSAGKEGPSGVLTAMGVEASLLEHSLRISSGWETEAEDWDALKAALLEIREIFTKEQGGTGTSGSGSGPGSSMVIDPEG